jgi:uncharacterized integral membrane protein
MIRFIRLLIIAIVAIVLTLFVFANREWVAVSFDPFASPENAAFAIAAPLFAVVIAAAMLGVIAGATATWFSQGRHRRAARQSRVEADRWRAEAQTLKAGQPASPPPAAFVRRERNECCSPDRGAAPGDRRDPPHSLAAQNDRAGR